jgi:hypothetical protein
VALVRTDFSEERIASITRVEKISELVTANAVPRSLILCILVMESIIFFETSVLTSAIRHHIPEDDILQLACVLYAKVGTKISQPVVVAQSV